MLVEVSEPEKQRDMKHKLFTEWAKTILPIDLSALFLLSLLFFTINVGFYKVWPVLVALVIWCSWSFLVWRHKTIAQQRQTAESNQELASHND